MKLLKPLRVIVMTVPQLHHPNDTASGKTMIMPILSRLPTMRSARSLRNRTVNVLRPRTLRRHRRWLVTAPTAPQMRDVSMTAIILLKLPIIRLRFRPWERRRRHCLA